jgi:copper homeostasis protein
MILLEICANSIASALAAQEGGATRIELCENLREGGTTPSHGHIKVARQFIKTSLYVLIRPRPGDFIYSDIEFEIIKTDIQTCVNTGCDGIAIGILKKDGRIDKERCGELVKMATDAGIGVTFHRAFDMCRDYFEALEDVIEIGCDRLLTSGGKSTAMEGARNIAQLVKLANNRIIIMPGSGVNEYNISDLALYTGAKEFHSSAKINVGSVTEYRNDNILFGASGEEYSTQQTDSSRVKKMIEVANGGPVSKI